MKQLLECILMQKFVNLKQIFCKFFRNLNIAFKLKVNWHRKGSILTLKHSLHFKKDAQRKWRVVESKIDAKSLSFEKLRQVKADQIFAVTI